MSQPGRSNVILHVLRQGIWKAIIKMSMGKSLKKLHHAKRGVKSFWVEGSERLRGWGGVTRGDEVTGVTGLVSKRMAWREDPFLSLRALMVSMEELGAGDQSHLVDRHLVTIPAHQGHIGELFPTSGFPCYHFFIPAVFACSVFRNLAARKEFSDVTLVCGDGHQVAAHRSRCCPSEKD